MQCNQINDYIMKYFDGNISELELEQLYRHNQKCTSCAEEFELMKDAIYEIENLPEIEPSVELTAKIMTAVAEQKHFQVSARQLICWLLGFVGLVLFTYNIIAYVIFPMMGVEPLISVKSVQNLLYMLIEKAKDGFVVMSVYLGKLLVLRDTLFREYTLFIFLWLVMFAAVDVLLYRLISMKKKNDFADLQ